MKFKWVISNWIFYDDLITKKAGKWDDGGTSSSFVPSVLGQDIGDECIKF